MAVPFESLVRASGLGEVWTHGHEELKFTQYGWRCTTQEDCYSNKTLIGNWSENRFDIEEQKKAKRLPSQYGHYYETTQGASYNTDPPFKVPEELINLKERHPRAFKSHQPELDLPKTKQISNSWETTQRAAYMDPKLRKSPINTPISSPQEYNIIHAGFSNLGC